MQNQVQVIGAGINCDRIFKIKALSGHRPDADPLLVAQGFIPFKKDQAFYVLAHYPQLDAYFVSNQYAVPFGRTALCGLVPAPLFAHVDLYSADSTKVPVSTALPTPPTEKQSQSQSQTEKEIRAIAAVVVGLPTDQDSFPLKVTVAIDHSQNKFAQAIVSKKYQDFARFHQAMKDHISEDKARFVPPLPQRPTVMQALSNPTAMNDTMRDLQASLQIYLNDIIDAGFIDALSLFLLPPGFNESSLKPVDFTPPAPESFKPVANNSRLSESLVQSPDMDSDQQQQQKQDPQPSIPNIPHPQQYRISNTASTVLRNSSTSIEKHQSVALEPSSLGRHSSLLTEATNRASFQSLGTNNPSDLRNSIASDSFFISNHRESIVSTNSRNSRASNRFSISSRRGSAMVGILTDLESEVASTSSNHRISKESREYLPPKAPVTLFGANGPVRSSLVIEEGDVDDAEEVVVIEDEEGAGETEEDVKKRNRNFVLTGLASELEGLSLHPTTSATGGGLKPPVPYTGGAPGSRRGSEAHHHPLPGGLPARTSSKQQGGGPLPTESKLLAQEANIINAYFEEDDLRSHAGEARSAIPGGPGIGANGERKVMRKEASTTSLRDGGISGRSSSLGWRKEG
ncbi:UNVERIFIED_CONTAM: hypothetical protein HDU68_007192 [Siphonaria sp. JEL0065]|nr:hypothetical protein HDU68_007192 [Siphonaria sp. JEL0065]